jgi:hypothetical protein
MVRSFIASDAKLTDELMGAASKISEEAVVKLMQNIKIDDVLLKAGLKNTWGKMGTIPETIKGIIGFDINSGTVSQIEAGLDSIEAIIKSSNLRYTYEGMEILKHTAGKRQQIEYFKNLKTNYITIVKKTPEIKIVKKTPEIKIVKKNT